MHLVLTGATGKVGAAVLDAMIKSLIITKVTIFSRRPVIQANGHDKVNVIIHKDFTKYDESVLGQIKDAQGCVWALGVSQRDVSSTDEYIHITETFPSIAASSFVNAKPSDSHFNFVYVSGEGATTSPTFFTPMYGRYKGQAETALLQLAEDHNRTPSASKLNIFNVRPGVVDAAGHAEIQHTDKKDWEGTGRNILRPFMGNGSMWTPTGKLGQVLVQLAAGDGSPIEQPGVLEGGRTLPNKVLMAL